jgi:hypothetical protein
MSHPSTISFLESAREAEAEEEKRVSDEIESETFERSRIVPMTVKGPTAHLNPETRNGLKNWWNKNLAPITALKI